MQTEIDLIKKKSNTLVLHHPRFVSSMLGLYFLALLRNIIGISFPVYIFLIYIIIVSFLLNYNEEVAFSISLIAFSGMFQFRFGLLITTIFLIIKGRTHYRLRNAIPLLLMAFWELLHISQSNVTAYGFFQEFAELYLLTVIMMKDPIDGSDALPIRALAYSCFFGCIVNLVSSVRLLGFSINSITRLGKIGTEITEDFTGLIDPYTQGFICMLAISGLLLLKNKNSDTGFDTVIKYCLVVFLLLTQSRLAVGGVVITYGLYFLLAGKYRSYKRENMARNFVIGIVGVVLIVSLFGDAIDAFTLRLGASDISNGRTAIFAFYSYHLLSKLEYLLYGIGLFQYNLRMSSLHGDMWKTYTGLATYQNGHIVYKVSHCNIQEVAVAWGIVGVLLMIFLIRTMIKYFNVKIDRINYVPLIIILIVTTQAQLLTSGVVLLGLAFALCCLGYKNSSTVEE